MRELHEIKKKAFLNNPWMDDFLIWNTATSSLKLPMTPIDNAKDNTEW